MTRIVSLLLLLTLAGCASDIPRPIREVPAGDIQPAQALAEADALKGRAVRWGGAIARIENRQDETWVEIVARPLSSNGEPQDRDATSGRFQARIPGFVDPAVYAPKRLMTVVGALDGTYDRTIGEFLYHYPVVRVTSYHLWPVLPPVVYHYYYPSYWYDPWYPWGYYPYPYMLPRR